MDGDLLSEAYDQTPTVKDYRKKRWSRIPCRVFYRAESWVYDTRKEQDEVYPMATNPNDIRLSEEDKALLAKAADTNGKPWHDVFRDALAQYTLSRTTDKHYDLDTEFLDWCAQELAGKEIISHAEARRILAKVSESLAAEIIADREDRL